MRRPFFSAFAALLLSFNLSVSFSAYAGQTCREEPLTLMQIERGMALAQATAKALDESGAQVVLLARAGQNLSEYHLRWSHLGFAYQEAPGRWRVLHKLNPCGTASGIIYRQGLGEFFMDQPWRYEAAFVALTPELQQALLPLLRENGRVLSLNEPNYSMLAYAWGTRFQQSNQWALETLAMAASSEVWDRATAQDWLQSRGYQPTELHLSALTRLGAETTRANITFSDHPSGKRFSGRIDTVTADSIFRWMTRVGLSGRVTLVTP